MKHFFVMTLAYTNEKHQPNQVTYSGIFKGDDDPKERHLTIYKDCIAKSDLILDSEGNAGAAVLFYSCEKMRKRKIKSQIPTNDAPF